MLASSASLIRGSGIVAVVIDDGEQECWDDGVRLSSGDAVSVDRPEVPALFRPPF